MRNSAVAVSLLDELEAIGVPIGDAAVRAGLTGAVWPARLERFSTGGSEVLLDAAHNPAGARALASYLEEIGWTRMALVFGAMRDKDIAGILAPLVPLAATVICTTAPSPRAATATELAELVAATPGRASIEIVEEPALALARARELSTRVVAAGSIFLIGPLRDILR
jgi:dihydrofolate synthase/folylpolyglutamate synthase